MVSLPTTSGTSPTKAVDALRVAFGVTVDRSYIVLLSVPLALGVILLNVTADAEQGTALIVRLTALVLLPLFWGVLYTAVASARDPSTSLEQGLTAAFPRFPAYIGAYVLYKIVIWGPVGLMLVSTIPLAQQLDYTLPVPLTFETVFSPGSLSTLLLVPQSAPLLLAPLAVASVTAGVLAFLSHFYDLEALQNEARPSRAILQSIQLVKENLTATLTYYIIRIGLMSVSTAALVLIPAIEGFGISDGFSSIAVTVLFAVALSVNITVSAMLGSYHVVFYEFLTSGAATHSSDQIVD